MKAIILLLCITTIISQVTLGQSKHYRVDFDKAAKKLILSKSGEDPAKAELIQDHTKVGLIEDDIIMISSTLLGQESFPEKGWKLAVKYDNKDLSSFFDPNKHYIIQYEKGGIIKFQTQQEDKTDKLTSNVSIILFDSQKHMQDQIEFAKKTPDVEISSFSVDLNSLQSCKKAYLSSLANTEADANLLVYTAGDITNHFNGKIEMLRNYKMNFDEKVNMNTEKGGYKEVFRGKGDLKLRKGTQLGVLSTNYNILNYKVNVSTQSSNYAFENSNLLSMLQSKLPKIAEAAEKGTVVEGTGNEEVEDDIESLLLLYRTISSDIVELQTRVVLDYCMLNDYFLKIRARMMANRIPISLSQFNAYSDQRAENQSDIIKNELKALKELYKDLFAFAAPPAPVFPVIIPPKDYQQFDAVIKTTKDNQTVGSQEPIKAIVVGGLRTSFSGSFLFHWLKDEKYFLTDSEEQQDGGTTATKKIINRAEDEEQGPVLAAGAQFNVYHQTGRYLGFGPSIGLASDVFSGSMDRLRFTVGGNAFVTTSVGRFGLTGGGVFGNISKLQSGFQQSSGANSVSYALPTNVPPMREVWKKNVFIGLTYSLPAAAPAQK